ncbi:MAG: hypothetical protein K2X03_25155 [Bryobacteraceae bacterium]|nr:hypothetical protein [Bryobacteraceae bacterium]
MLLISLGSLSAQSLTYRLLPPGDTAPTGRVDGTIAYAPSLRRLYLFGGQDTETRNDLWAYSLDDRAWTRLNPSGALPPARLGHTLVWDARRSRLVLFGGQARGFFSDVWAYDVASGAWQQLARDDAGPSRRYGHSAILEPGRDRMVISHGFTSAGRFDDTWSFNLATNAWQNLTPAGTKPLRRCLHHAVYDPGAGQMLLYGGCASGFGPCPLGDLWAFDLATNRWTERTGAQKPPAREHYGMVFDEPRSRLVIYGGEGGGLFNDTWEYGNGEWRTSLLANAAPPARSRHEAAFAADRATAFFFGGRLESGEPTNELWSLSVASTGPRLTREGISGPVAPGQLVSIYGSGFGPAEGVSFRLEDGALPVAGQGISVTWNGLPAPLSYARTDQLNVQVPYELAGASEASLQVTVNGEASSIVNVPVAATRPVLFAGVFNQDGTPNSATNPARTGDAIVFFATGQGATSPPSRTGYVPRDGYPESVAATAVTINGERAEVLFRGQAPGTVGIMQVNARIPVGLASGARPVRLRVGASESEPIVVYVVGS